MITIQFEQKKFAKDMSNIISYSQGFLDGVQLGKKKMNSNFAQEIKDSIKEYFDSMARVSPQSLHHVYEWNEVGNPSARLFEINCEITNNGISVQGELSQSSSIKSGSSVPFYNKAEVMERGIPVRIRPIKSDALTFKDGAEDVFVKGEVVVSNPGGNETTGSFSKTFDDFFGTYFSQVFILSSGVLQDLENPSDFAKNLNRGKNFGRDAGIVAGKAWAERAGQK